MPPPVKNQNVNNLKTIKIPTKLTHSKLSTSVKFHNHLGFQILQYVVVTHIYQCVLGNDTIWNESGI